jgi:hypothetical protein
MNEQEKKIISLIDRGTWKHSWHLRQNQYGAIDWRNKQNIEDCLKECQRAKDSAMDLLVLAREVNSILNERLAEIKEEEEVKEGEL